MLVFAAPPPLLHSSPMKLALPIQEGKAKYLNTNPGLFLKCRTFATGLRLPAAD